MFVAVDEIQVEETIPVVVDPPTGSRDGLRHITAPARSVLVYEVDAGILRHLGEARTHCRGVKTACVRRPVRVSRVVSRAPVQHENEPHEHARRSAGGTLVGGTHFFQPVTEVRGKTEIS